MEFIEFIQNECGGGYPLSTILYNLSEEEIVDSVNNYVKAKLSNVLQAAKQNARFESGTDKVGFIYISQLEELLKQ